SDAAPPHGCQALRYDDRCRKAAWRVSARRRARNENSSAAAPSSPAHRDAASISRPRKSRDPRSPYRLPRSPESLVVSPSPSPFIYRLEAQRLCDRHFTVNGENGPVSIFDGMQGAGLKVALERVYNTVIFWEETTMLMLDRKSTCLNSSH